MGVIATLVVIWSLKSTAKQVKEEARLKRTVDDLVKRVSRLEATESRLELEPDSRSSAGKGTRQDIWGDRRSADSFMQHPVRNHGTCS